MNASVTGYFNLWWVYQDISSSYEEQLYFQMVQKVKDIHTKKEML